ncbi:MAG: helix-turn-helix domain-containing protein [Alphaproteobacteria bacterium]|nr:helix-turn-helix domain-containing protein [Alphaproteobacteria bacterium]
MILQPDVKKPVVAVRRAARILRYLGRSEAPVGVNQIARDLDIIPSTCLHILRTLAQESMVTFNSTTKQYRLGHAVLGLARDSLANSTFVQEARPHLKEIADRHGVTVTAAELDANEHMVVVALARAPQTLSIHVDVSSRFPALISASGRCYAALSGWPDKELAEKFDALPWENPPDYETWRTEVSAAGQNGYAVDYGNYLRGFMVTAAPVVDSEGYATRAIATVGFLNQLDKKQTLALAKDVKTAASQLTLERFH